MGKKSLILLILVVGLSLSSKTIYLTRHGQVGSKDYVDKVINESKLTPLGKKQAKENMIYLIRHCQAASQGVVRPILDDAGITDLGIEQSKLLGKELKKRGFSGPIFASPYFRTVATACLAAEICQCKVYPDSRIQERVHGKGPNLKNGGAKLDALRKLFPNAIAKNAYLEFPWIMVKDEPHSQHRERMLSAFDALICEYPKQDIAIVSHAGAIGQLASGLGKRANQMPKGMIWNCAIYQFAINGNGVIRYVGYDVNYLPENMVTSNLKDSLLQRRKQGKESAKSGVDYKL